MAIVHVTTNTLSDLPRRASRVERRRLRVSTLERRCGLDRRREAVICRRNGRWVRQVDWHRTLVGKNDVIEFVVMPKGSDTLRTVASIAVLIVAAVAAPYIAGPLAGALGITSAAGIAGITGAVTASLAVAGNYALNAIIPPTPASSPGLSQFADSSDSAAPTYAFTASSQQNLPRLGGAIPELFGSHRIVPDLGATAWWEWAGGKQTLYQTLVLTKGEIEIDAIELGRTSIDSFESIDYQKFEPGETADLFEPEVYQAPDVTGIPLTAPNDLVSPDDGIYGPFAALPPGQTSTRIGLDIQFPRGLFLTGVGGALSAKSVQWRVEAQKINDAGAPIASWFKIADETFNATVGGTNTSTPEAGITGSFGGGSYAATDKLNSPLTVSYRYTLPDNARYQIRCRRLDTKDLSSLAGHDVAWTGLRGFTGGGDYGDVSILQIAITATASVNDRTVRQIAVTGTRKLPVYDPDTQTWSDPQPTRSIAWAAAHVLRSDNGGRLSDADYDLEALAALDEIWTARGDKFDFYASATRILWDMLQTILRCGRAVPYRQGSQVRFHRDAPQTLPVTGFSRENIVQRTLKIGYRLPDPDDDSDGIEIKYFDRLVWNYATLRKKFYGAGEPERPISRPLDGCTVAEHAQRELDYMVAEFVKRPITAEFDTELEGMIPSYGELVLLQHDSPEWGLSNRVLDYDADAKEITLFSPPIWDYDNTLDEAGRLAQGWFARIRDVRGRYSAQIVISAAPASTSIVLHTAPTYDDGSPFDFTLSDSELLHVVLGKSSDAPRLALFREMTPRGQGRAISVKVVLESDDVHVN